MKLFEVKDHTVDMRPGPPLGKDIATYRTDIGDDVADIILL